MTRNVNNITSFWNSPFHGATFNDYIPKTQIIWITYWHKWCKQLHCNSVSRLSFVKQNIQMKTLNVSQCMKYAWGYHGDTKHRPHSISTSGLNVKANTDLVQQSQAQVDSSASHINVWVGQNYTSQFCLFYETVLLIRELCHWTWGRKFFTSSPPRVSVVSNYVLQR
jgi:hypothetical protein